MALIDPSPSSDELQALAAIFARAEASLQQYLSLPAAQQDPNFVALNNLAISLNNIADTIAVMQLHLATADGAHAVDVINQAAAEVQRAIIARNDITHDLAIVQDLVAFGAAIAAGDVGSIISAGGDLYGKL